MLNLKTVKMKKEYQTPEIEDLVVDRLNQYFKWAIAATGTDF